MSEFAPECGDRVRVDLPDETDPDHSRFHGKHGTVVEVFSDEAAEVTGENRDNEIYRVRFEDGTRADFRWTDLRPPLE